MKTTLPELLRSTTPIVADGGMGTMLFAMGLERGDAPERWNIIQPEKVRKIHRGYIEAGAQIILTNSFGGSRYRLQSHGLAERAHDLNRAAAKLARAEADAASHPVVVAGSIGPTGQMLAPLGDLSAEDAKAAFAEQAAALADGGVDVFWIETMSALEEVRAAREGCAEAAPGIPCVATMTFDTKGRTMMGVKPEQALAALAEMDLIALGANCGNGPDELEAVIEKMHAAGASLPLIAKANAGVPRMESGATVYDASPQDMAAYARRVRDLGATVIGTCCGSTPDHIRAINEALRG